jgi:hypothetical protein
LPTMQFDNRVFYHLRNLHLLEKLLIQGVILTIVLVVGQAEFDLQRQAFMSYMPPLGFVFFLTLMYLIQPIIIGVLNIFLVNTLYKTKGWQVGFWLNGVFLLLTFLTINLLLQTSLNLTLNSIAIVDIVALSFPLGCVARFSNGGWKKPIN